MSASASTAGGPARDPARAAASGRKGGASTITQQLAKILFTGTVAEPSSGCSRSSRSNHRRAAGTAVHNSRRIIAMYLNRFDGPTRRWASTARRGSISTPPGQPAGGGGGHAGGHAKNPALFNPAPGGHHPAPPHGGDGPDGEETARSPQGDRDSPASLPLGLRLPAGGPRKVLRPTTARRSAARPAAGPVPPEGRGGDYLLGQAPTGSPTTFTPTACASTPRWDRRMQWATPEWAVKEHLGTELQTTWRDLGRIEPPSIGARRRRDRCHHERARKRTKRYRISPASSAGTASVRWPTS